MNIDTLIFDFDGLILDTETPEYEAWRQIYNEHGFGLSLSLWSDSIGRGHEQIKFDPYEYLSELLGSPIDHEAIRQQRRAIFHALIIEEPIRPGVVGYLNEAKGRGMKLAVASSSARDWVEGHLDRLGILGRFDLTRCSDDVLRTKPEPDLYLAAMEVLGTEASRTVAFEDSPNGSLAAMRAGIYTVVVPNSITAPLLFPEVNELIASMADVPLGELLERAVGGRGVGFPIVRFPIVNDGAFVSPS